MLTKPMRRYVESPDMAGYNERTRSVYNSRLKNRSKRAIEDLTLVAQKAWEREDMTKTVGEIFIAENLAPLIHAILEKHPSGEEKLAICKVLVEEGCGGIYDLAAKVLPWNLLNLYSNESQRVLIWAFAVRDAIKMAKTKRG